MPGSYNDICLAYMLVYVWLLCEHFLPDIEHIYMSEKKSNQSKENTTSKKSAKCWQGEMLQKVASKIYQHQNNSVESQRQWTHTES